MNDVICHDTPMNCDGAKDKTYDIAISLTKFEQACKDAKALAAALGPWWKGVVWENLGWHYKAISQCRRLEVHPFIIDGKLRSYSASIHAPGESGQPAHIGRSPHAKTPKAAVAAVVRLAREHLAETQKLVEGL